ncbi:permease [Paenibacillus sp. FSL R7-0210]|uniref:permease n=1 Tax=Paenibacillus sp. FSL R7-0210 TaxID=2921676 RepID=UPI0030F9E9F5
MPDYSNFKVALYFTTRCISNFDSVESLRRGFDFFEKHLNCSKVYLETHRDDMDMSREQLEAMKQFFLGKGIAVSGAITTTLMKTTLSKPLRNETGVFGSGGTIFGSQAEPVEEGYKRSCTTLCYTNEEELLKLEDMVRFSASVFDEVIIDDFFFTNCTCPSCIKAKGDRSWADFRLQLMTDVSENVVMRAAKAVNPKVNMIIKFPDWYEAYQETGYNPETQAGIFDEIYTGTETRDSNHSAQSLPRYGSYSLMRWLEKLKPGHNAGGWIDSLGSTPHISYFLEQAYLTLFAKGRELTLFCYSWLIDTVQIPALGHELGRLDQVLGAAGNPVGLSAYEPFHARGEDHLYDHLGMAGFALEPAPQFPDSPGLVFISASGAQDPDIMNKLSNHLLNGSDVCITSGFLREMQGKGIEELTSARYTGRKACSNEFVSEGSAFSGSYWSGSSVLLPVIEYMSNAGDCLVALKKENHWAPVLLRNKYGNGTVYVLTVPDDYVELYQYPAEVLTIMRQHLMGDLKIYLECGGKISVFLYDNDTFILESFADGEEKVKVHVSGNGRKLVDVRTGDVLPVFYGRPNESVFEVEVQPLLYRVFKLV